MVGAVVLAVAGGLSFAGPALLTFFTRLSGILHP